MLEHYTEAFVLGNKGNGEMDAITTLFTRDFGKVIAKAKSAKKITSKLNGHLQPLNFVNCRLVEPIGACLVGRQGGMFQIVDALTIDDYNPFFKKDTDVFLKLLDIARFIEEMTFELHEDRRLWQVIKKIYSRGFIDSDAFADSDCFIYRGLLKILGFDPAHAVCASCNGLPVQYFFKPDHVFLCGKCYNKVNKSEVVSIN